MNPVVTRMDLEGGFRRLGLKQGMEVEVHSSLSKFGRVEGGAATVVDALMAVVGPAGTIVMSAYPLSRGEPLTGQDVARGITYKSRVLPGNSPERTNLGAVVDEFRLRPDVQCGTSIHRSAVWGANAEPHLEGYSRLLADEGKALLLGVGIGNLSSMHVPEHTVGIPKEIQALSALPPDILRDYPEDQWYVECDRVKGPPDADPWGAVWREAVSAGFIKTGRIGNAECHFFTASDVVGIYERRLRTDPWSLFGVPKPA